MSVIEWEREQTIVDGEPIEYLVAVNTSACVTMRLRIDPENDWICAFSIGIKGQPWTLPQIEDWMLRVAELIDLEPLSGHG